MIRCKLHHLEARCRERGYTLDDVRQCIVSQDGDALTVDELHPAFPRSSKPVKPSPFSGVQAVTLGPGGELKKLLRDWLGVVAAPNCACNARAKQMDDWGPDECERRLPEIVGWLKEQAASRHLPFVRVAATQLVRLAIRRARKSAAR